MSTSPLSFPPDRPESPANDPAAHCRKAQRRKAIIETATRCFVELGFADCEMDRVAHALGIAKGTLYLYFRGKEELFRACVEEGMETLQREMERLFKTVDDPLEIMARSTYLNLDFFDRHPEQLGLMVRELALLRHPTPPAFFRYRMLRRHYWVRVYEQLRERDLLREELDVDAMGMSAGNLLYGTVLANYFMGRTTSMWSQFEVLMSMIYRGVLKPGVEGFDLGKLKFGDTNSQQFY